MSHAPSLPMLDPRQIWLTQSPFKTPRINNRVVRFVLVDRETKQPLQLPILDGLPGCFHGGNGWDGTNNAYWDVLDTQLSHALEKARAYGFRTDAEDVRLHGDPGLLLPPDETRTLFGAATFRGRPGDIPFTLVRALVVKTDRFGNVNEELAPSATLQRLFPTARPVYDEYADDDCPSGFALDCSVAQAQAMCLSAGFMESARFPACLAPEDMFACVSGDAQKGRAEQIDLWSKEDIWAQDDLRDGMIAWMPAVIGSNLAEGAWDVAGKRSVQEVEAALVAEGYTLAPNPWG